MWVPVQLTPGTDQSYIQILSEKLLPLKFIIRSFPISYREVVDIIVAVVGFPSFRRGKLAYLAAATNVSRGRVCIRIICRTTPIQL